MNGNSKQRILKSGELAKAAGISADTLSHYEKLGLLPVPKRTEVGYRLYPSDTLARVQMIQSAVYLGFSLAELADVLKQRRAGHAPCRTVAELASKHLKTLNEQILDLTQLRDWFAPIVENWESRLKTLRRGECAAFLEKLSKPNEINSHIKKGNNNENNTISLPLRRHHDKLRARQVHVPNAPEHVNQRARQNGLPDAAKHF